MELTEPVVRAKRVLLLRVVLRAAAIDDRVGEPGKALVVREQRAPFAGRHDLRRLVAEGAEVADAPSALAVPTLPVRVSAILDHRERVASSDLHQPIHIRHLVPEMHGDDRAGPRGDRGLHERRVDRPGLRRHIDDHGKRTRRDRRVHRGGERERGDDHLVSPADPERLEGHLHRHGPVGHQHPVPSALVCGEGFLERCGFRAGLGEPAPSAAPDHLLHGGDVLVVAVWPLRVRLRADGDAAGDRELYHRSGSFVVGRSARGSLDRPHDARLASPRFVRKVS